MALDSALGESDPSEVGFGPLTIANGAFLIPASTLGSVLRFALDGSPLAAIGSPGNIPGTLNFPVAVETGPNGMFLVIDKHRYCVVGYDAGGRYPSASSVARDIVSGGSSTHRSWPYRHPTGSS